MPPARARHERAIIEALVPALFPDRARRYLDFACGTGRITSVVGPFAVETVGVDISATMVAQARTKCASARFVVGDATRDDLGLGQFDLATSFRFLGNAQDDLRRVMLRTVRGLLVDDGVLIVNNHRNPDSLHGRLMRLKGEPLDIDLSYRKLDGLLREAGCGIERAVGIGLWSARHSFREEGALQSSFARWLEPLSRIPGLAPLCPDMVLVCRAVARR